MGDHRADIKITFSMYGETKKADMWINWSPDDYGVDPRVLDFFSRAYEEMYGTYIEQAIEHDLSEQDKKEADERREYERLRTKFEHKEKAE
jgi:hypothetical protein